MSERPDVFAFYLPQFYPIPHNDTWWGEGFTEWNTLLQAQRTRRAPQQARLTPGSLGFYDARLEETRAAQGRLAREAGLSAFAVYHYWSLGDRIMPEVVDRMLADGSPDMPFFFCWANHHWTRAWSGQPDQITWHQHYEEPGDDRHIDWLLEAFADPRYYRIGSAPVIAVYDVDSVPRSEEVFARWRERAREAGHSDLVIIGMAGAATTASPQERSLDAWVQSFSAAVQSIPAWRRALGSATTPMGAYQLLRHRDYRLSRAELDGALQQMRQGPDAGRIPQVVSGWNNVGRRSARAWSMPHSPEAFAADLAHALDHAPVVSAPDGERRLVCVNAWNEWGEGMTLEPSVELGDAMLRQMARVLEGWTPPQTGVATTTNPR